MRKTNTTHDEELLDAFQKCGNISESARLVGVGYDFARNHLIELGAYTPDKRGNKKTYDIDKDIIQSMLNKGMTIAECAREIDVRDDVVRRFAEKHGMYEPKSRPQKYKDIDFNLAEHLYIDENMSLKEVADNFGVTEAVIQHWFAKKGIKKDSTQVSAQRQRIMTEKYGVAFAIRDESNKKKMDQARAIAQERRRIEREEKNNRTFEDVVMQYEEVWNSVQNAREQSHKQQKQNEKNVRTLLNADCDFSISELVEMHLEDKLDWKELNEITCMTLQELKEALLTVGVRYMMNIKLMQDIDTAKMCIEYQNGATLSDISKKSSNKYCSIVSCK